MPIFEGWETNTETERSIAVWRCGDDSDNGDGDDDDGDSGDNVDDNDGNVGDGDSGDNGDGCGDGDYGVGGEAYPSPEGKVSVFCSNLWPAAGLHVPGKTLSHLLQDLTGLHIHGRILFDIWNFDFDLININIESLKYRENVRLTLDCRIYNVDCIVNVKKAAFDDQHFSSKRVLAHVVLPVPYNQC